MTRQRPHETIGQNALSNLSKVIGQAVLERRRVALARNQRFMIGIDGYYASGKTTLANALFQALLTLNVPSVVVETDWFMKYSRDERRIPNDRYLDRRGWYDLEQLECLLVQVSKATHQTLELSELYSHQTGRKSSNIQVTLPADGILILEGVFSLDMMLQKHLEMKIFTLADHFRMLSNALQRDPMRGLSPKETLERYWLFNGQGYTNYFEAQWPSSDMLIDSSDPALLRAFVWKESSSRHLGIDLGELQIVRKYVRRTLRSNE